LKKKKKKNLAQERSGLDHTCGKNWDARGGGAKLGGGGKAKEWAQREGQEVKHLH